MAKRANLTGVDFWMRKTAWKVFREGGEKFRIRAEYGFDDGFAARHNQAPYFSVTGETNRIERGLWCEDSGGCIHEQVAKHFPELAPVIKWHGTAFPFEPMHYVANAVYWAEMVH